MKPVLINTQSNIAEAVISKVGYGIELLKNDSTTATLYVAFNHSVDDGTGDYIMLRPGESIENYDIPPFGKVYHRASANSTAFRLYTKA